IQFIYTQSLHDSLPIFIATAREQLIFLDYAPVLITSSLTGEHVSKLFGLIEKLQHAARQRVGTGVLNRLLRQAFEASPPPTMGTDRKSTRLNSSHRTIS